MEPVDLGDINNLSAWTRRHNLRGLFLFENLVEGDFKCAMRAIKTRLTYLDESFLLSIPQSPTLGWKSTDSQIPRSPLYLYTWELLASALAQFIDSYWYPPCLRQVYGHPNESKSLGSYSKTDLLSFLVGALLCEDPGMVISGLKQANVQKHSRMYGLYDWLSHPRQRQLPVALLSSSRTPRAVEFVLRLVDNLTFSKQHGIEGPDDQGCVAICLDLLLSLSKEDLTAVQINTMFRCALQWPLLPLMPRVLERMVNKKFSPSESYQSGVSETFSDTWDTSMREPAALQCLENGALLLKYGAPPNPGLVRAIDAYLEASETQADLTSEKNMILLLLSHGADTDVILERTYPLTIAEYGACQSSTLATLLRPWVKDPISVDVITIYEHEFDAGTLEGISMMSKEIVLLAIFQTWSIENDQVKDLVELGVHPDLPSLFPPRCGLKGIGRSLYTGRRIPYSPEITGSASERATFGCNEGVQKPIDIACAEWDIRAARLLLDRGSSIPWLLVQSKCHDLYTRSSFHRDVYQPVASQFMAEMSSYFNPSDYTPQIGETLLNFAIFREDISLLRKLFQAGVDFQRGLTFGVNQMPFGALQGNHKLTPFLIALTTKSITFAQEVWRINPQFVNIKGQSPGAFELVELCSSYPFGCVDLVDKISYLLELGAGVNSPHARDNTSSATPLQAILQSHYDEPSSFLGEPIRDNSRMVFQLCEHLLSKGADVNASDGPGPTPLQLAADQENFQMMKLLLKRNADANITHYQKAKRRARGVISNPLVMISGAAEHPCKCAKAAIATSSHRLCSHSRQKIEMVELLLRAGADCNFIPIEGDTPLIAASRCGCLSTVQLLIKYGSDVNRRNHDGCRPIEAVCNDSEGRRTDIAFLLLHSGAEIGAEQGPIDAVLWDALKRRCATSFEVRMRYLQRGKALCYEALEGSTTNMKALLEAGADINYEGCVYKSGNSCIGGTEQLGGTPLYLATLAWNFDAVLYLLENGADIDASESSGDNAFYSAIEMQLYDIVQLFLNMGASRLMKGFRYEKSVLVARRLLWDSGLTVNLLDQWVSRENPRESAPFEVESDGHI